MSKMVRRLFLVLCWVVVCASGCDCGDTTLSQFPELVIEPPSLVYPVLTVGETNTQTVTLSSRGLPLSIFSIIDSDACNVSYTHEVNLSMSL